MQDTAAEDSDLFEWYGDFGMALPTPTQEPSVAKPKDTAVTKPTTADAAVATTGASHSELQSTDIKPVTDASGFLAKVKQQTAVSKPAASTATANNVSNSGERKLATSDDTAVKAVTTTESAKADTQSKQQQQPVRSQQLSDSDVKSKSDTATATSVSSSKSGTPSSSERVSRDDDTSTEKLQPVRSKADQEAAAAVVAAKQQADKRQVSFNERSSIAYVCR
jgi:acetyl/propionyl-CoA carboxylase alpha subunit